MDRRLFLSGLLGVAGTLAVAKTVGPGAAEAAVAKPDGGILEELAASEPEVTEVDHRRGRRRHWDDDRHWHRRRRRRRRPHGRHRRRVWRRVCRRVRRYGEWYRRCWREPVWIWT